MPALFSPSVLAVLLLAPALAHAHPLDAIVLPTLREYFVLGVEHILGGYDHLLFVAGLVIASFKLRELVWTVSAFTIAHSITLGLGMMGVVAPSSVAVELLIALSIAYVGYENLRARLATPAPTSAPRGRVWLVMLFGLAHGFGFAGAIADVGLPADRKLGALAFFNLGVEAGQLSVVTVLWPALALVRKLPRAERVVAQLVNATLIVAGMAWTLQRSFAEPEVEPSVALASVEPAAQSDVALSVRERAEVPAWVSSVCHALQGVPRERRAQCAGVKAGVTLTAACETTLAASVAREVLEVDRTRADQCVAAIHARYEGCAWTEARVLPPIDACLTFIKGLQKEGASCASSLECETGTFCHGAGAFERGVCGQPRQNGARCELAADPLASYAPMAREAHPECEGQCFRGRCGQKTGT
jgi:hypothetical protein